MKCEIVSFVKSFKHSALTAIFLDISEIGDGLYHDIAFQANTNVAHRKIIGVLKTYDNFNVLVV